MSQICEITPLFFPKIRVRVRVTKKNLKFSWKLVKVPIVRKTPSLVRVRSDPQIFFHPRGPPVPKRTNMGSNLGFVSQNI
jgi:hypothetical protein